MSNTAIPVIDFTQYGLLNDPSSVKDEDLKTLATVICDAFRNIGFAYFINHGIDAEKIGNMFKVSKNFFSLPKETKSIYGKDTVGNTRWEGICRESLNPEGTFGDLKETVNFMSGKELKGPSEVENFNVVLKSFFQDCTQLTYRVLDVLSLGLELDDRNFLRECHSLIGQPGNNTCLRTLYYPEMAKCDVKPGMVRCGEHSDYGTVTFLFQDNVGGLEVQNRDGVYIPVTPIPGAIVVNIGDLMQRWSGDELRAMKHRVLIPEEELKKKKPRQSIAFFVNPDNQVMIKCLDGSDKYSPVSAIDYLKDRYNVTSRGK